jgi:hypothetical protein
MCAGIVTGGKADRDLLPEQQVALSQAISQFPATKFEVYTTQSNREAHALALKIADAVKVATSYLELKFITS